MNTKWRINSFLSPSQEANAPTLPSTARYHHSYKIPTTSINLTTPRNYTTIFHQKSKTPHTTHECSKGAINNPKHESINLSNKDHRKPTSKNVSYIVPNEPKANYAIPHKTEQLSRHSADACNLKIQYYIKQLEIKDKAIQSLTKQNTILKNENKQLIKEKSESTMLLRDFAHSMGSIMQSLISQKPVDSQQSEYSSFHRQSYSTASTELIQQADKLIRDLGNQKLQHTNKLELSPPKSLRKSLTSIIQERFQTTAMVQNALNEMQSLLN